MVTRINAQEVARQAGKSARTAARAVRKNVTSAVNGTLGVSGERMSKVDTAWLRMDCDSNLMMIVGVWIIKPAITYQALCDRVEERLLKYPRFTQRVVPDAAGATWVVDKDFDITRQVVTEKLSRSGKRTAQQALQDRLAELAMLPLDDKRPLWQFHLVENYDGGSAMMVRIHHCIADGIALIGVLMSLTDAADGSAASPDDAADGPVHRDDISDQQNPWEDVLKPVTAGAIKAINVTGTVVEKAYSYR